jgi:hypothetical protein
VELLRIRSGAVDRAEVAPFKNEVQDLQSYLETHLDLITPGMRLLARQLDTGEQDRLDILAAEPWANGHRPVIVELKNITADEEVLLQCLRYARWLMTNPDSLRLYAQKLGIDVSPGPMKVVIVAPEISTRTIELASFMKGNLDFEFVEVQRFRLGTEDLLIIDRRVPVDALKRVQSSQQEQWGWTRYETELRIKPATLELARRMFERVQKLNDERGWGLVPVFRKWYVPFQLNGSNKIILTFSSTSGVDLEVKLPEEPSLLGLPANPGQKWSTEYHQVAFRLKPEDDSLTTWLPFIERAMK